MGIEIISSGLQTTVQDLGRAGWRHMGVPESGGADKFSLKLANFILGKSFNSPVLECTLTGPTLKFSSPYSVTITGADMNPKINNKEVEMNQVIEVEPNDILSMDNCSKGCRSYIAFSEDILAEDFLGSTSTYLPAKLGGIEGLPLTEGSVINTKPCKLETNSLTKADFKLGSPFENKWTIRVIKGPEYDFIKEPSKKIIFSSIFTVSNDSNRMGNRLTGVKVDISNNNQMISCPMAPGTIQCPENGLPIILGCDSQTLGGYPRILQIAAADLHLIGQLRPNDSISFEMINVDQARKELMKQDSLFSY